MAWLTSQPRLLVVAEATGGLERGLAAALERSLVGAFALGNPTGFHRADGAGYRFIADRVLALDPRNPMSPPASPNPSAAGAATTRGARP